MSAKEKINNLRRLKKESLERYNERIGPNKKSKYDKTEFCFSDKPACHNLHDVIGDLKAEREELDNLIKELDGQCTQ